MVPLADSTIYEMEQRGEFPRRFALSPRCVVWDLAEVEAWLASRRSSPIGRAPSPDVRQRRSRPVREPGPVQTAARSEEHTSELQSLMRISYAVFCLKKKKTNHKNIQEKQN